MQYILIKNFSFYLKCIVIVNHSDYIVALNRVIHENSVDTKLNEFGWGLVPVRTFVNYKRCIFMGNIKRWILQISVSKPVSLLACQSEI